MERLINYLDSDLLGEITMSDDMVYHIFEPTETMVVLPYHRSTLNPVFADRILVDRISVTRSLGGGDPFVIQPGLIVISCVKWLDEGMLPRECYFFFNTLIKESLDFMGLHSLEFSSINELSLGPRVILTSSLRFFSGVVFYQGLLLVNIDHNQRYLYINHYASNKYKANYDRFGDIRQMGYNFGIREIINALDYHFQAPDLVEMYQGNEK